ncbi:MAG: heme-binding domain-containing protein [Trueperaceae bacterium]|nr:heme-binding domain-containing protein [Trueperaceae bacterium]
MRAKYLLWLFTGLLVLFIVIQFIPLAGAKTNPPVQAEPQWDSPQTRELAVRACYDCHSNETVWPWYSNVAPISWLVIHDTMEGREKLNFSEWNLPQREADEAAETVQDGEMPLKIYLPTHPEARLTNEERDQLIQGLINTIGGEVKGQEREGED